MGVLFAKLDSKPNESLCKPYLYDCQCLFHPTYLVEKCAVRPERIHISVSDILVHRSSLNYVRRLCHIAIKHS